MPSNPNDAASIAIVGMAGRFPGASNLQEFWGNLCSGVESVRFFAEEELLAAGELPNVLADPGYVPAWPVLDGIDQFDAAFFGLSPRDAAVMDPQHRLFLQVAWHALEHAGYAPDPEGAVGVFAACGMNAYMMHHLVPNPEIMRSVGEWLVRHTGNDMNFLATRASYQMNIKGPSLNVQTACSSSLVAVHLACQSLLAGECDAALAGASALALPQDRGYLYNDGEILSPTGHCRPFDAESNGTLFGSGAGCVVLKRLQDAVEDGDAIWAVIRGSAINNDGADKVGYLAPSVDGQSRVLSEALDISGIDPDDVGLVETHGTGTAVGDPIEFTALRQAFGSGAERQARCVLGSVKANIGHLGEAAGMAGLIKTVLSLKYGQLPPSINFSRPNPELELEHSAFEIRTTLSEWTQPGPRRAGVTALGAGGTNAHVVLEQPPMPPPVSGVSEPRRPQLLVLSAKSESALAESGEALASALESDAQLVLEDVAFTLQFGRKPFAYRSAIVAASVADAPARLRASAAARVQAKATGVVFMFPGGGAQYAGMGRGLYEHEGIYSEAFDACLAHLPEPEAQKVRELVLQSTNEDATRTELSRPSLALPALFSTCWATAQQLMAWGVKPSSLVGHSMGEYVAAALSGVFSLGDALKLVLARGRLFETLPEGTMLSVGLAAEILEPMLGAKLSIAAVNAPELCVAAGPVSEIERLAAELEKREVEHTRIHISVAAHSEMLDPILEEFEAICRSVKFGSVEIPFASNLTGSWITPEEAADPAYWVRHLRQSVRFSNGVGAVLQDANPVMVEVGPGRTLASLSRLNGAKATATTIRHPKEAANDVETLLSAVGRIWELGGEVDFAALHGEALAGRRRQPLPGYAFAKNSYWLDRPERNADPLDQDSVFRKLPQLDDWFYVPGWRRAALPPPKEGNGTWIVVGTSAKVNGAVCQLHPASTIRVDSASAYRSLSPSHYELPIDDRGAVTRLFREISQRGQAVTQVVFTSGLSEPSRLGGLLPRELTYEEGFREYFGGLLAVTQALSSLDANVTLTVLAKGVFESPSAPPDPLKALLHGPVRVVGRENPQIRARLIELQGSDSPARQYVLKRELDAEVTERSVLVRGGVRFCQTLQPSPIGDAATDLWQSVGTRPVVLVTGGLGGIGMTLAERLAETHGARLVLVGRTSLPERRLWEDAVAQRPVGDGTVQKLRRLLALEEAGAELLALSADVTDRRQLEFVRQQIADRFGRVNVIVHAAGVVQDAPLELKLLSEAAVTIDVKARGALALEAVFAQDKPEAFVAFSSVSSVLGLAGQVDYTAANAFLDSFALASEARGSFQRAFCVGWNTWQEVGMAVALVERSGEAELALGGALGPHPCLERIIKDTPEERLFATSFSRTKHWVVGEHVVKNGEALLPGTGYLELACAAAPELEAEGIELAGVSFFEPFVVPAGSSRRLYLSVKPDVDADAYTFEFYSEHRNAPHATGRLRGSRAFSQQESLTEVQRRLGELTAVAGWLEQSFMDFGMRWGNVRGFALGDREALIRLALEPELVSDLGSYALHPAMLDMATGGAQRTIPGFDQKEDFLVPVGYESVRVYEPLQATCFSHVRYVSDSTGRDIAKFDVTIYDDSGEPLVVIAGFTMKRVKAAEFATSGVAETGGSTRVQQGRSELSQLVALGIRPEEGAQAFERVFNSGLSGPVFASSIDVAAWLKFLDRQAESPPERTRVERSESDARFEPPENSIQRELAGFWKELLGVVDVGLKDDFFELGGHSLIAVRLFTKIRRAFNVDLPLSTLFEAPTLEQLSLVVAEESGIVPTNEEPPVAADVTERASEPSPVSISGGQKRGRRWSSLVRMQPNGGLTPFFCVAGMGGTLHNLRKMALYLGAARPVYGLQPPGADDQSEILYSIEQLGSHYLTAIREVQPSGPYCLGGYSGGGVVAFELARQLSALGEQVAFLGFLDSFSPALGKRGTTERFVIHARRLREKGPGYVLSTVQRRLVFERERLARKARLALVDYLPGRFRYEALGDSFMVADAEYRPEPWKGEAVLFRAASGGALSEWTAVDAGEAYGWEQLLSNVEVVVCPGDHTNMCEEPNVQVLASKLRDAINRATGGFEELSPSSRRGGPASRRSPAPPQS